MMRLVRVSPDASSLRAMRLRLSRLLPVYTAKTVSNELPSVEMLTRPLLGAVQDHQTEAPPRGSLCSSSGSNVAWLLWPLVLIALPLRTMRLAKSSLRGGLMSRRLTRMRVLLFFSLDSRIRLCGSAMTSNQYLPGFTLVMSIH